MKQVFFSIVVIVKISSVIVIHNTSETDSALALSNLRHETERLRETLSDLQKNYSALIVQHEMKRKEAMKNNVKTKRNLGSANQHVGHLKDVMRLLNESIHSYDNFIQNKLEDAQKLLCEADCHGNGGGSCEFCSIDPTCEVAEKVRKKILNPFQRNANRLRERSNDMLAAINNSMKFKL